ncbi:hypothetical protein DPV78_012421 [Talaromyces pinophilus]|nr:hypothetical protein DPV78_012421 [Talaromyces pinophilus]
MMIVMSLGFGPRGIVAGSIAAAFQSFMYGGFTPAGGIFATFTSMAMLGTFIMPFVIFASVIATGVSIIFWKVGVGQ